MGWCVLLVFKLWWEYDDVSHPLSPLHNHYSSPTLISMSSPSTSLESSYINIGMDNLEHPLNCPVSPHAQVGV